MKGKKDFTSAILEAFEKISAVPRQSKNEAGIIRFLTEWANWHGFPVRTDAVGNLLIEVPGTKGYEKAPPVILQGHLDMVCEKLPESKHDFTRDPIKPVTDGDWLRANGTSLGADNGIAIAMAMVVAENPRLPHPPLELLFTVDEETGLTGALNLKPGFFKGRILLNLDSEDEGVFTIGCAGGRDTHLALPLEYQEVPDDYLALELRATGMAGGHSGVNIHEERANAIRVLVRVLARIASMTDLRLVYLNGGTAHNAIPRDAEARFFVPVAANEMTVTTVESLRLVMAAEFRATDPNLKLSINRFVADTDGRAMTTASTTRALDLLFALPHGVAARSAEDLRVVETSNNLAKMTIADGELRVTTSQRSLVMSRLDAITHRIEAVARLAGATAHSRCGYPSWRPDYGSPLLETCKSVYRRLHKEDPKVEVIHAGLECGIIGDIAPGMQMISFGCTIKDPHSPQERVYLPSIAPVFRFLTELLEALP